MANNGTHNVAVFADTTLVDDAFKGQVEVFLGDARGNFIRGAKGTIQGIAVSTPGSQTILGTVNARNSDSGFTVEGGFVAPRYTQR